MFVGDFCLKETPYTLFFYKNVVFPAQAEYSYFSADFRLKIFLYYSYLSYSLWHFRVRIYFGINYKCLVSIYIFCAEYCTYVLHVPFIERSLALNTLL